MNKKTNKIEITQKMKSIALIKLVLLMLQVVIRSESVAIVSEQTIKQIFIENKIYTIYVTQNDDLVMESYFNQYCSEGYLCAILNKSSSFYDDLFTYIHRHPSEYFLIIDAARKNKYVMPIIQNMNAIDIRLFLAKFQQGLLQPYYASQKPQMNSYLPCRKVVGKNLDEFLSFQAPLKVLYLYSEPKYCQNCGEILRKFADFAQKTYDPKMVIFGYYHILKNDHEKIKDEQYPHFLIFSESQEKAQKIELGEIGKLEQKIIELLTSKSTIKITPLEKVESQKKQIMQQL